MLPRVVGGCWFPYAAGTRLVTPTVGEPKPGTFQRMWRWRNRPARDRPHRVVRCTTRRGTLARPFARGGGWACLCARAIKLMRSYCVPLFGNPVQCALRECLYRYTSFTSRSTSRARQAARRKQN